jgi:hypothetical protein
LRKPQPMADDPVEAVTKRLKGHRVSVALINGSHIADCDLVSAGRRDDDRL